MKGKIHPFQIILSLLIAASGIWLLSVAYTRVDDLFRDFSFIILNFVLFCGILGLIFTWLGLTRIKTITIGKDFITEHYLFGLFKRTISIGENDRYSVRTINYRLLRHTIITIENDQHQQISWSNWRILNHKTIFEKFSTLSLSEEKLKIRTSTFDKAVIYTLSTLFIWLMISTFFNLTF